MPDKINRIKVEGAVFDNTIQLIKHPFESLRRILDSVASIGDFSAKLPKTGDFIKNIDSMIDFKARLKEQQDDVLYLCVDKVKAIICLESLISVIKGEEKESEDSYMGMLLITDTICKMNIFLTKWLTSFNDKEEVHVSNDKITDMYNTVKPLK